MSEQRNDRANNENDPTQKRGQGFIEGKGGELSESQRALRRLLIVLAVALGLAIYAYGWTVTEIDLSRPQEEQRQENVTRALRELLSPRLFEQPREVVQLEAAVIMVESASACSDADIPAQADPETSDVGVLVVEPACVVSGDAITLHVRGASPSADARVRWVPPAEEGEDPRARPRNILETDREDFVLGADGNFTGSIEVPRIRGGEGQVHQVRVLVAVPSGPIQLSETSQNVIDRIAETIFMALVATTVAIPIAAALSFFAARNLMQQVRMSAGGILLAFVAFVIGVALGGRLLAPLGELAVQVGSANFGSLDDYTNGIIVAGVLVVLGLIPILYDRRQTRDERKSPPKDPARVERWRTVIHSVVLIGILVAIIGLTSGLLILIGGAVMDFGSSLQPDAVEDFGSSLVNIASALVTAIGRLLDIIGTLLELFIVFIGAVLSGFALATVAGGLLGAWLRRVPPALDHGLGVVLGALGGGLLMVIVALIGLSASLLGLLPLLVAAVLGGALARMIVSTGLTLAGQKQLRRRIAGRSSQGRTLRWAIFGIGAVTVGLYTINELNIVRSLVDGTLPTQEQATLFGLTLPVTGYVFQAGVIGAVLGGITGGLAGVRSVFPLGSTLYNVSRISLNIVRSIEPLIMGLVFVVWVGIGPFAGVLALTLHSIAALGKLYSEQIENIDEGPLEALRSTGANHLQTIVYAVVPQIIPPYIAFTMYRWDINVRMSTIIGFVGGGGIGLLLQQQINLLRYRDAGVAVLAIAVVVSVLDYASAVIRERLT